MEDGSQCTLRASAVRNLLRYVDLLGVPPLVVGLASALVTGGRRIGDHAADTIVVRSTAPENRETAVAADADTSAPPERAATKKELNRSGDPNAGVGIEQLDVLVVEDETVLLAVAHEVRIGDDDDLAKLRVEEAVGRIAPARRAGASPGYRPRNPR